MSLMKPCLGCGDLAATAWCTACRPPKREPYPKRPRALGYDTAWDKLSRRARAIQKWCSDCGTEDDLTCDHSEAAWRRKAAGQPIRLTDVDVVCRSCNGKRGRARPTATTREGGNTIPDSPGTSLPAQVSLSEGTPHGSTAPVKGSRTRAQGVPVLGEGVRSWRAL